METIEPEVEAVMRRGMLSDDQLVSRHNKPSLSRSAWATDDAARAGGGGSGAEVAERIDRGCPGWKSDYEDGAGCTSGLVSEPVIPTAGEVERQMALKLNQIMSGVQSRSGGVGGTARQRALLVLGGQRAGLLTN